MLLLAALVQYLVIGLLVVGVFRLLRKPPGTRGGNALLLAVCAVVVVLFVWGMYVFYHS